MKSYLTFKEAAEFLNITNSHLRSLVFKKKIPFIKFGRLLRFDIAEINSWVKARKHGGGQDA